jgi:hypothetical protein
MGPVIASLQGVAGGTLLFGLWSAARPERSIALYQAIMRAFNWRVEPIDRPREVRTTRWLGLALAGLSLLSLLLMSPRDAMPWD